MSENMKWYVVHTYSGHEHRARQLLLDRIRSAGLEDRFGEILIPTENVIEIRKGAKRQTRRKFYPGYMLVQMVLDEETYHLVKDTQKITGFVGGGAHPTPIREEEVRRITEQMQEGAAQPKTRQKFDVGMSVRITAGPFVNFTGRIEEVREEKQKLRVLVTIFGRATPVEVDFTEVEIV